MIGYFLVLFFLLVIFVLHVADDRFQKVLHGDDTGGAAVFVDDDRHLHLLFLKGFEQISAAVGFPEQKIALRMKGVIG